MKNNLLLLLSLILMASCSSRKEIVYFQNAEKLDNTKSLMKFEPVIEVNDILRIDVSSFDDKVVEPFQMNTGKQQSGGGGSQNQGMQGYLVDIDGDIQFPVLGKIPVAKKSRSELEAFLTNEIHDYVTDAVIAVRIVNFRVIVLGEAGSQTVVDVKNERMSIPELFASVGGISYDGERENILVIRESDGVRSVGRVDITSADVFSNPYYYLKQNDIVYVEPTLRKVKSAGWVTSPMGLISIGTTIFGLIALFTR
jgi:polysaccharide export outer membrane protein